MTSHRPPKSEPILIVDSPDEKKQPTIEIKDKTGKVTRKYHMPSHAHLMVQDGETVEAGDVLAKIPRETTKAKDITGGLPRVVELFEARKPKDPAVIGAGTVGTRAARGRRGAPLWQPAGRTAVADGQRARRTGFNRGSPLC